MTDPNLDSQDSSAFRTKTILCIEDEIDLRTDIAEELSAAGYDVVEAANGREALARLETVHPDLILCDITMPELNGYEFMAKVRSEREDLAEVPFIFLTALADRTEMLNGKNAGADDYLVKPVDYDDLLATVKSQLRMVERVRKSLVQELEREQKRLIQQAVRDGEVTLAALAAALDRLSIGIFVIAENGEVRIANEAARRFAETAGGLLLAASGSQARSINASKTIRAALTDVLQTNGGTRMLTLERNEGHPLVLQLSPIELPGANSLHAVAFVIDPDRQLAISPDLLSALFGCTAAETRLAAALVAGKKLEDICEELGVKQTTITFHLKNLFQKTQTHRQADLVALLIRATMPFSPGN